jgi:hypothetical protein
MGRVQDAIGDALVAEIESRREWDEPPAVFTVYYSGGRGHLGRLPIPDATWYAGPPAEILAALADATTASTGGMDMLRKFAPAELHGAAFFTEVWMATAVAGSAADADLRKRAAAVGGRVSQLPDRVEARSMWAVDRAGITYTAIQARGEDEVKRSVSYPKPGEGFTGTVPRALDKLVTAFLGVTLPDRERTL